MRAIVVARWLADAWCAARSWRRRRYRLTAQLRSPASGWLPDTLMSRSIVIRMRRRAPSENVEPYRRRDEIEEGHGLRGRLAGWAAAKAKILYAARPVMPLGIEDRNADVWEAMFAIADAAGGDWPTKAREAAVARGNAPLVIDLVAGQVKAGFVSTVGVIQHVREGRLKGLAISSAARSALAPNVPTTAEAGYPAFKLETYFVLLAPAGLPDAIVELLEREVRAVLKAPDLQDKFLAQDIEIVASTAAEARAFLRADTALWARIAKDANLRVD